MTAMAPALLGFKVLESFVKYRRELRSSYCLFQSVAKETRFNFVLYHGNCPAVAPVR